MTASTPPMITETGSVGNSAPSPVTLIVTNDPRLLGFFALFGSPSSFAAAAWPNPEPSEVKIAGDDEEMLKPPTAVLDSIYSTVTSTEALPATSNGTTALTCVCDECTICEACPPISTLALSGYSLE